VRLHRQRSSHKQLASLRPSSNCHDATLGNIAPSEVKRLFSFGENKNDSRLPMVAVLRCAWQSSHDLDCLCVMTWIFSVSFVEKRRSTKFGTCSLSHAQKNRPPVSTYILSPNSPNPHHRLHHNVDLLWYLTYALYRSGCPGLSQ